MTTIPKSGSLFFVMENNFKSWKPEFLVSGKWSTNALRFATELEAMGSVKELMSRWYIPEDGRATQCDDPVNYKFQNGRNMPVTN